MIKLKDILSETKVGHLVEADKKLTAAEKEKIGNEIVTYKNKETGKNVNVKVSTAIQDKKHPAYKKALLKLKSIDKKSDAGNEKIKNSVIKAHDKKKGEKIEVKVDDVLMPPFGSAKKIDDSKLGTKEAKKLVYNLKKKKAESKAKKEVNARKKKNKGKFKLTKDEQEEFKAWKEDNPFVDEDTTEEDWFKTQKPIEEVSAFHPVDGEQWETDDSGDEDGWLSDLGDDNGDDDWGEPKKTDDYGHKLSTRGNKTQQQAVELKLQVGVGNLKKQTKKGHHYVMGKDGKVVALSVFKNEKTGKFYGVSDEGDIYESDKEDFRDMKEPTTNARGFAGAVTSKGQKTMDIRKGKGEEEDEYDKTTFTDLLGMLGIDTDVDWTDPFGSD